ncbi:MAG: hypothetical protein H6686_12965 [Fibrobacteria bacterium]|nr:hypothetical protein [Fibrobacteria bacterium]
MKSFHRMLPLLGALAFLPGGVSGWEGPFPQLPIGMNIGGPSYWSPSPYLDPMLTSGGWIGYHQGGPWDDGTGGRILQDEKGWPLSVPQMVDGVSTKVRTMLNNCREGVYEVSLRGNGKLAWSGGASAKTVGGKTQVTFNGNCGHAWMSIDSSDPGDPIRDVRLTPLEYVQEPGGAPLFDPDFLRGLRPFHALRFMDWTVTNGSRQMRWKDRPKPGDRSFGVGSGMPWEHAMALSEELGADAWICVPHAADDDYIRNLAILFRDSLKEPLKVYLEYSNEIWNWGFKQAHWVGQNGADRASDSTESFLAPDSIRDSLRAVGTKVCKDAQAYCHPEKDAWMMGRLFRIWEPIWSGKRSRLVTVATGQHAWTDNSRRILNWLVDEMGIVPDAFSVGGYVGFDGKDHERWMLNPDTVKASDVAQAMIARFPEGSMAWTIETARIVRAKGIKQYLVYEGGQHAQPYQQSEWPYNQAVWDAQIHPLMREIYLRNFQLHDSLDCDLFMAFSYTGERESRYGSWGHLETYAQSALSLDELRVAAPKYAALLESNTPKSPVTGIQVRKPASRSIVAAKSVLGGRLQGLTGRYDVRSLDGRVLHSGDLDQAPMLPDGVVLVRPLPESPATR